MEATTMMGEAPQLMRYAFETIVSIGITLLVFIGKDFRSSLKEVTTNLNKLTLSVTSLIEKDNTREGMLSELKARVSAQDARLRDLELTVIKLSAKEDKE